MKTDVKDHKSSIDTKIELHMCARPDYLPAARATIRQVAQIVGLKEDVSESITLAVIEALTNVIRHGYGGPCDKRIILKLDKIDYGGGKKAALEIVIRDFGKQIDPEDIKGRDLDDIRPGGVGVHIINSIMDHVEFKCADDCGMQLRMIKYV